MKKEKSGRPARRLLVMAIAFASMLASDPSFALALRCQSVDYLCVCSTVDSPREYEIFYVEVRCDELPPGANEKDERVAALIKCYEVMPEKPQAICSVLD